VCYVGGISSFEEKRHMRVGKPINWKMYRWMQMSVHYQADSRMQGGKVQGETGGKMI
jgi:hypothetical protein